MTQPPGQPVFIRLGPPPDEPNQFVVEGAPRSYPPDVLARLEVDAKEIIGRYPDRRSALLPLLHLVQGEDSYLTPAGLRFCADQLGLTGAEVSAVASFYTMYRRRPIGSVGTVERVA
ncbi:NAD(P)H-dependent oxidoreductase subunit E, partial [Mycobacterium tuberculosis]|uniref:NAD(P)H-dependent oxidoreductase subunit E n=1 Tax=Mycobacterium tuberculosis TaxID=1773 RepID=UPI00045B79CB